MNASAAQADWYHGQATVQRQVADDLAALFLDDAKRHKRILEIGCGTGFLTRHLDPTRVLATDPSPAMIERARRELPEHKFHVAGLMDLADKRTASLLVSSSALHWVEPLEAAARQLAALAPNIAISIMLDGTLDDLRHARHCIAPELPPRHRMPSLTGVARALRQAGFHHLLLREKTYEATYQQARDLLKDLQRSGLTGAGPGLTPKQVAALEQRLDLKPPVTARYRVGFFQGTVEKL